MKIVFIAGPYIGNGTEEEIERNIKEAEAFAIALANWKIPFFCAHTHTSHFEIKANASENFYKNLDMYILKMACNAVLATPRWQQSTGAKKEIEWARQKHYPIFFPKSPQDENVLSDIEVWCKSV